MSDLRIIECDQGSQAWFEARIGKLTGSIIADAVAKRKRGDEELACRLNLRYDLATERVIHKPLEHFVSKWMEFGKEMEPMARAAYEIRKDVRTRQVGFVLHPSVEWSGASPDGLLDSDGGLVEFKCPKNTTHFRYLNAGVVPEEYIPQMMWQMACCPGREWNDFVSYCADFPEPLDLFICRLPRDEERIKGMEAEAQKFLQEVGLMVTQLTGGLEAVLRNSLPMIQQPSVLPRAHIPVGDI